MFSEDNLYCFTRGEPAVNNPESMAGKAYLNTARRITGEEDVPFLDLEVVESFMDKILKIFKK